MIRNLNKNNFAAYGAVPDERADGHAFPSATQWRVQKKHIERNSGEMYCCENADIYLDYDSGMAVLMVAAADHLDEAESFYLDKAVCVRPGVYFCVLPFDEHCDIHVCARADAIIQRVARHTWHGPEVINANMGVRSIRTLFYQVKEGGFFFKGESHRQYELTCMEEGSMHSIVGGRDYMLLPGEMMLYGPNQWHSQYCEDDARVCFITIAFDMDCDYASLMLNRKMNVDQTGRDSLNGILCEARQNDILSGDIVCCRLTEFLLGMIRSVCRSEGSRNLLQPHTLNSENALVDHALRFISGNIETKLTVAAVAAQVNVSPSYLSVLFGRHLRIKPSDYIRREKLEEAKRLIRQGSMSFTQIADRLKFSSVCHFSNLFKCAYGMTPTEYARSVQK